VPFTEGLAVGSLVELELDGQTGMVRVRRITPTRDRAKREVGVELVSPLPIFALALRQQSDQAAQSRLEQRWNAANDRWNARNDGRGESGDT
jgi:hypothetical protein